MARIMLAVTDSEKLSHIPELLQQAGIVFRASKTPKSEIYTCTEGEAEVSVVILPKQALAGVTRDGKSVEFHPIFVFPKPGFFRSWTKKGAADNRLQAKVASVLEPITDAAFKV